MNAETPRAARVEVTPNGPYLVTGGAPLFRCRHVVSAGGDASWEPSEPLRTNDTYTLCRCGGSARKPFCDGTHRRIGFDGSGPACSGPAGSEPHRSGPCLPPGIGVLDDGPLALTGVGLRRPDGTTESRTHLRLCRCGRSADKPFCDDSHVATGFRDADARRDDPPVAR